MADARTIKTLNQARIQDRIGQSGLKEGRARMVTTSDIGIIMLVMAWSLVNHSLVQDWIRERKQEYGVAR